MEESVKTPQISDMLQRFAIACKTRTIEFFAEEEEEQQEEEDGHGTVGAESVDEFITDQKVVVIKPDTPKNTLPQNMDGSNKEDSIEDRYQALEALISCIFANVSAVKGAYVQLQTAHTPFEVDNIKAADRAVISQLQKLSELKRLYAKDLPSSSSSFECSQLEARVQERQSMLRTYEMMVNRLQSEIDLKDAEVCFLREEMERVNGLCSKLEKKLKEENSILLSVGVFDSLLQESLRGAHSFTKMLIDRMREAGWNLDLAANSIHKNVNYAKRGHNRYAFLSYVCLGMFSGFDKEDFCCSTMKKTKQKIDSDVDEELELYFAELMSLNGGEVDEGLRALSCDVGFVRYCREKYLKLIHPRMEEEQVEGSMPALHMAFLKMARSVWLLHKLAFSFEPRVRIFQVRKGLDFSMVYMEDVARRGVFPTQQQRRGRAKVAFTVVPGFRIGKTIIQCQVYLV
ncbi:IRK-interacting protein [Amborella trichopoda]|uniref:Uncharacterized protein n=1 Tax=Amborella trichopoda TaxID=13333 RepID=W1NYD5_AMBTC|nr:IRK-interacting protein [Amborella trichopoda]ERN02632.1 hypothetical protein AMTR_s00085p00022400 [Amborella trichopoda]|eukprot:XP_006840957.1 IRK-interacting protein [Amborella trichopoda]